MFSYFKKPIKNITPCKNVTLLEIYNIIKSDVFENVTNELRKIEDEKKGIIFKSNNFDYVTFSGLFSLRNNNCIVNHSGLIAIDFDNLSNVDEVKQLLLQDEYFETELLFVSPSGNGLKWIIEIDLTKGSHLQYFQGISNYLLEKYKLHADKTCKDVSRACFIPQDKNCYINPKHIQNV